MCLGSPSPALDGKQAGVAVDNRVLPAAARRTAMGRTALAPRVPSRPLSAQPVLHPGPLGERRQLPRHRVVLGDGQTRLPQRAARAIASASLGRTYHQLWRHPHHPAPQPQQRLLQPHRDVPAVLHRPLALRRAQHRRAPRRRRVFRPASAGPSGADVSALGLGCAEKQVGHPYLSPLDVGWRTKRLAL